MKTEKDWNLLAIKAKLRYTESLRASAEAEVADLNRHVSILLVMGLVLIIIIIGLMKGP